MSLTLLLTLIYYTKIDAPLFQIGFRFLVFLFIYLVAAIHFRTKSKFWEFLHWFYPLGLLAYFYPETANFNLLFFQPFDHYIIAFEESLIGTELSLDFSKIIPNLWFNEWLSMGYFSFYFLIFGTTFIIYLKNKEQTLRIIFIIMVSFFFFYVIFIVFPVVGPQYYYHSPDSEVPLAYFFSHAVKIVQDAGERPTGAFPSSHAGITTILLFISYHYHKKAFPLLLFFAFPLVLATVYLKAHYVSDVLAGLIVAPIFYYLTNKIFDKLEKQ